MYNCDGIDANRESLRESLLLVTTKLLFLLDYLAEIHILLRFRDKKNGKLKPRSTVFESFMNAQNLDLGSNFE